MWEPVVSKCTSFVVKKTLGFIVNKTQKLRVSHFAKGITKSLATEDYERTKELLSGEFAEDNLYDFVSSSINSSSEISRYAIGKLYADYQSYPSSKLPYNKTLLLKALSEFDDLDVMIFLAVIDHWKTKSSGKKNQHGLLQLEVEVEEFSGIKVNDIAVEYLVTQRIFNNLFSRGLLDEAEAMIGQYSGLSFAFSDLSQLFYDYLVFGHKVYLAEPKS